MKNELNGTDISIFGGKQKSLTTKKALKKKGKNMLFMPFNT